MGAWQWPYRGVLVGEASHPGPILVDGNHFPEPAATLIPDANESMFQTGLRSSEQVFDVGGIDMDETQETAGGATIAASFHVGPQVELLSQTELSMEVDDLFGDLLVPPAMIWMLLYLLYQCHRLLRQMFWVMVVCCGVLFAHVTVRKARRVI